MVVEARAMLSGLKRCAAKGFLQVEIEADSLILVLVLKKEFAILWSIAYEARELFGVLNGLEYHI